MHDTCSQIFGDEVLFEDEFNGQCCTASMLLMLCFELSGLYLTVCVCTYCH